MLTDSVVPTLGTRRVKTASNMDGFYDQQVPFVYPESVSFWCCTTKFLLHLTVNLFNKPCFKIPEMPHRERSEMSQ